MESHKRSSLMRIMAAMLSLCLLFFCCPVAYASPTATTETPVGSSMYSVTTALTAFASNVVGANTNDKHSDKSTHTDGTANQNANHRIWELSDEGAGYVGGVIHTGDAGCIVGYGDKSKGFIDYLAANETRSVTTSSYGAYTEIGDDGKTYSYVRYGRLLTELGIDSTGNPSEVGMNRGYGVIVQGIYNVSSFVPFAFGVSMDILRMLNPFRFLVQQDAIEGVITETSATGTLKEPFEPGSGTDTMQTGDVTADPIDGVNPFTQSGLNRLSKIITEIYVRTRAIGSFIIIPFVIVCLIASMLLTRRNDKFSKLTNVIMRMAFVFIGIPLLGAAYTALLDSIAIDVNTNQPSGRIIAATFVDFENWVKTSRLNPPAGVTLVSEGISDSEPQGKASPDSWRTVRETIYQINYNTQLYDLQANSGLGLNNPDKIDVNAGMWDTDGNYTTAAQFAGSDSAVRKQVFNRLNAMLGTYAAGTFYTASSWGSNVNSSVSNNFKADLGSTQGEHGTSANKKTVYQMYFDTDEVDDWMDRSPDDNARIFIDKADGSDGPEEARWCFQVWNIFSNGLNVGPECTDATADIAYTNQSLGPVGPGGGAGGSGPFDAVNPANTGALSTVSMYNYLSSAFNQSNIAVYSAANTTSEYTRLQHYSVNTAGSGVTGMLFVINCMVCLGVFVVLGLCYCGGMVVSVLTASFRMIMQIPGAMFTITRSIIQVLIYVVSMVLQLMGTVFLYQVVMDLVVALASVVESPILDAVKNIDATAVGGILGSGCANPVFEAFASSQGLFGLALFAITASLVGLGFVAVRLSRAFLCAWSYCWTMAARACTFDEFLPVFDEYARNRTSLYIWDEVAHALEGLSVEVPAPARVEGGL